MKKKNIRVLVSFLLAAGLEMLAILMFEMTGGTAGGTTVNRLGVLFGGNFINGGYIQFLEYIFFFWGSLEVIYQQRTNKKELSYLNAEVLPEQEHLIIGPSEVNQIRVKVANYLRKKQEEYPDLNFYLVNMIKRVTTKFRANLSIAEALEIVNTQTQVNLLKAESRQSFIRYTACDDTNPVPIDPILEKVRRANNGRVRINTIGVGSDFFSNPQSDQVRFMTELARENDNGFFIGL